MKWHILTWNPVNFEMDWDALVTGNDEFETEWATGGHKNTISEGDGLFFLMQGSQERGIIAHGVAGSDIYQAAHWNSIPGETANYVTAEWNEFTTMADRLPTQTLLSEVPGVKWNYILSSGYRIDEVDADRILKLWEELPNVWTCEGYGPPDPPTPPAIRDGIRNQAIEEHAESVVMERLEALGYEAELVGDTESWDITATLGEVELHVEVKGSSRERDRVSLTRNEVTHSRAHAWAALAVVDQIAVTNDNECSGGRLRVWQEWSAGDSALSAIAYDYNLPDGHADDFM